MSKPDHLRAKGEPRGHGPGLLKRFVAEPLVHFLVAGALLFVVFAWLNRERGEEPRVVRITQADVKWLTETWTRQWQRPPDEQELRGVVADYLKETLLEREARELGLDEGDTVVRRRLAQKMEFLIQNAVYGREPDEDALRRLYDNDRMRYRTPTRISFTQVYFKTETAAVQGLRDLGTHDAAALGEPSLLERDFERADEQTVTSLFGDAFAAGVFAMDPGKWEGPVASAYGLHLVRVRERETARPRPFEEVRLQVLEEWYRARQDEANEELFAGLLAKYDVVVDEGVKPLLGAFVEGAR